MMLSSLKSVVRPATRSLRLVRFSSTAPNVPFATSKPEESDSFCMNLFRGQVVTDQVFPYPLHLEPDQRETLRMMLGPAQKFLKEVNKVHKNDEDKDIPRDVLDQFAKLGAFGAIAPSKYEGAGLNNSQMAKLAELVGSHDLALGVVMGAHQSIGYKGILMYGNEEQKNKYMPDLAAGRKFAAFALTEPSSGSDAKSCLTRAVLSPDGKNYIMNGQKMWISNAGFADVITVFAQVPVTYPDGRVENKMSAFIVEKGFEGVSTGPPQKKMGIRGSNTTEIYLENAVIPAENVLGEVGDGFKIAMNVLNNGRFGIPAACTGAMKFCIQKTVEHIIFRVQFGRKLEEFENVQEKLVHMIARCYATESLTYLLASNMDKGINDYQLEAAIGKVFASDNAWWVCDEAIQVHGGMGFMKDTGHGLERWLRDLRIFRIFEGANDVLKLFVSLTGSQYAGKRLKKLASGGVGAVVGEVVKRASKSNPKFESLVDPSLRLSAKKLDNCIKEFGKTVESLLIKYKKDIIDRQYELIRLADAAIDIYSMVATLSRCTHSCQNKTASAAHEQEIANFYVDLASARTLDNLREAFDGEKEITRIRKISKEVCLNRGMTQKHPIDI